MDFWINGFARCVPARFLAIALLLAATSCATTGGSNPTITTDISGFPLKEGEILMEH